MGEAKRRKDSGISPREKNNRCKKSDKYISWLPFSKTNLKKFPYIGVVTMALGTITFLVSGGFNTIG